MIGIFMNESSEVPLWMLWIENPKESYNRYY